MKILTPDSFDTYIEEDDIFNCKYAYRTLYTQHQALVEALKVVVNMTGYDCFRGSKHEVIVQAALAKEEK